MTTIEKIEKMERHDLRDLLMSLQDKIAYHARSGRLAFERAMQADKEKDLVEKRLSEIEDFQTQKPKNMFSPEGVD